MDPVEMSSLLSMMNMYPALAQTWNLGNSPCQGWLGIKCDGDGHIASLTLYDLPSTPMHMQPSA
jgi:hypothetical protein